MSREKTEAAVAELIAAVRADESRYGKRKWTTARAKTIACKYLAGFGYKKDSYGNYKISDTNRWHFSKQRLQRQRKIGTYWQSIKSYSPADFVAYTLIGLKKKGHSVPSAMVTRAEKFIEKKTEQKETRKRRESTQATRDKALYLGMAKAIYEDWNTALRVIRIGTNKEGYPYSMHQIVGLKDAAEVYADYFEETGQLRVPDPFPYANLEKFPLVLFLSAPKGINEHVKWIEGGYSIRCTKSKQFSEYITRVVRCRLSKPNGIAIGFDIVLNPPNNRGVRNFSSENLAIFGTRATTEELYLVYLRIMNRLKAPPDHIAEW